MSLLFSSAISVLSAASSKFLTSVNAALETEDLSTNPKISPSSEPILMYSPTDNALDVIAVTKVGFDSPITKPKTHPNTSLEPISLLNPNKLTIFASSLSDILQLLCANLRAYG